MTDHIIFSSYKLQAELNIKIKSSFKITRVQRKAINTKEELHKEEANYKMQQSSRYKFKNI